MTNGFSPHLITDDRRVLLNQIATCRLAHCPVVERHPFYPVPVDPPLYQGQRPCLPVSPVYTALSNVMIIGQFPNCRFATVEKAAGEPELFVPVADITEPFEGGRYFDGYSVRDYPTADSLHQFYLTPLKLDLAADVWLTNMVKCFLMTEPPPGDSGRNDRQTYEALGWVQPTDLQPRGTFHDYFDVAAICASNWLRQEIERCNPKLIIALGERSYRLIHGADNFAAPAPDIVFDDVTGVPLLAHMTGVHPLDNRFPLFAERNVIHLSHPSRLLHDPARRERHLQVDIPATLQLMQQLGCGQSQSLFQIFKGQDQQFYFRLGSSEGQTLLNSEGYTGKAACLNGIGSVMKNAPLAERYQKEIANNQQHFFNLVAKNGHVIGTGTLYDTVEERDQSIEIVRQQAPFAQIEDMA